MVKAHINYDMSVIK